MTTDKTVDSRIENLFLANTARLVAVNGPLTGETLYLDEPVVSVGRLGSNEVCLEDPFVSRHHCVIRNEGDGYLIEDLNSANGTYLNGERVNKGLLEEGCLVQIGVSQLIFKLQNPEESLTLGQNLKNDPSPLGELKAA